MSIEGVPHAPYARTGGQFAIALAPIDPADWFEPDAAGGGADAASKQALYADHPQIVWKALPGSERAQAEALRLVEVWAGVAAPEADAPPLFRAALLVRDDLCLMEPRAGGWTLTAASLSSPTFFTAHETVGLSLSGLHDPVPGFGAQLLERVVRIFDHLPEDKPLVRRNWTVVNDPAAFAPDPAPSRAVIGDIAPERAGADLFVRVERQSLRRLPETRAVLFSIRVHSYALDALRADPERLAAFAKAWREATPEFRAYKKLYLYDDLMAAYFKDCGVSLDA